MNYKSTSFEPRIAYVQLVFGVIYTLIAFIFISLGLFEQARAMEGMARIQEGTVQAVQEHARQNREAHEGYRGTQGEAPSVLEPGEKKQRQEPSGEDDPLSQAYVWYVLAILFALLAVKSFFIAIRVKNMVANGRKAVATLIEAQASRGISIVRAKVETGEGTIGIETRYAGETIAKELTEYLKEHETDRLPALIVGKGRSLKGMLAVRSSYGRLDLASVSVEGIGGEEASPAPEAAPAEGGFSQALQAEKPKE